LGHKDDINLKIKKVKKNKKSFLSLIAGAIAVGLNDAKGAIDAPPPIKVLVPTPPIAPIAPIGPPTDPTLDPTPIYY
jgi:hypothetical protein